MKTIHAQVIGDCALVARSELDALLELARRSEPVELELHDDDPPTRALMHLADHGGAFDFWREHGEDIYTATDGEPL